MKPLWLAASFNFGQFFGRDFQGGKMTNLEVENGQEEMDDGRKAANCFSRHGIEANLIKLAKNIKQISGIIIGNVRFIKDISPILE